MTVPYPNRLSLAQLPTPIHPLDRFSAKNGLDCRLWIKRDDLTGCAASGNKVRKLEFILAEAQLQGADVIITCGGVQSNHARATAILSAQLGMQCHLLLRGEPEELTRTGNHFLDLLAGANISHYPSREYLAQFETLLNELIQEYRRQGLKPYFIPTGGSDPTGVWGYVQAAAEIRAASAAMSFDHIVCACGSGGTLAGLIAGASLSGLPAKIWGINVCDTAEHFRHKVLHDLVDWKQKYSQTCEIDSQAVRIIDGYVGRGYGKSDAPVYRVIRELAALEGILLDPIYTAKAFCGMLSEIKKGQLKDAREVLFIHTGGLFGLMADRDIHYYL